MAACSLIIAQLTNIGQAPKRASQVHLCQQRLQQHRCQTNQQFTCRKFRYCCQAATSDDIVTSDLPDAEIKDKLKQLLDQEEGIRRQREQLELELLHREQQLALQKQREIYQLRASISSDSLVIDANGTQPGAQSAPSLLLKRKKKSKRSKKLAGLAAALTSQRRLNAAAAQPAVVPATSEAAEAAGPSMQAQDPFAGLHPTQPYSVPIEQACVLPKPIFVVSDCTGESAARTVRAALGQFELLYKTSVPANLVVFRFLQDEEKCFNIIKQAAEANALVVYTLVDAKMLKAIKTAIQLNQVKAVDLWSNLLDNMEEHLQTIRMGVPLNRMEKRQLSQDYFRFIEAVEYTRKMDDGANPEQWKHADLLLLGVSRSGKTPLSIYLGQRGYKVANLPLVPGVQPPKQLWEIDQHKVVGLIIDAALLVDVRRTRLGILQLDPNSMDYTDLKTIRKELQWAQELYSANPVWPVLDVTFRGVEESAARILRIMSDRYGDVHPMWSEGYASLISN